MPYSTADMGGCGCCMVRFLTACSGVVEAGIQVTVKDQNANIIDQATSDAQGLVSVNIEQPGIYAVSAPFAGHAGFSARMKLACGDSRTLGLCGVNCMWEITVSGWQAGVTGTATVAGNSNGITASVSLSGTNLPVAIVQLGTAEIDPAGYTGTVAYGGQTATLQGPCSFLPTVYWSSWTFNGCLTQPMPGWTVTTPGYPTQTSDANGMVHLLSATAGAIQCTATPPDGRWNTYTGPWGGGGQPLTVADAYVCTGMCNNPIKKVLQGTDSVLGAVTLTYGNVNPAPYTNVSMGWNGVLDAHFPAGCGCPAASVPILFILNFGNVLSPSVSLLVSIPAYAITGGWPILCVNMAGSNTFDCPGWLAGSSLGSLNTYREVSLACDPLDVEYNFPSMGAMCLTYTYGTTTALCGVGAPAVYGILPSPPPPYISATFTVTEG